jgi:hypothetical protein
MGGVGSGAMDMAPLLGLNRKFKMEELPASSRAVQIVSMARGSLMKE